MTKKKCPHCKGTGFEVLHPAPPELVQGAIEYLNKEAGTNFRWNSRKCKELITARHNEDWLDIKDYQLVVDKKCKEWLNDGEFERYLQPSTLFGPKFGQYHGQKWTGTPGQRDWSKKHGGSY